MDTPVLKPGGFWICPACGQRNKVWAPCSKCGTALAGMAHPEARLSDAAPATAAPRRSWLLYALVAGGIVTAIGLGVVLSRLLSGAALVGDDELPGGAARAEATPVPLPPAPTTVPPATLSRPMPPPDVVPTLPPAAVYSPSVPAQPPGYSIPAPARPAERPRLVIIEGRSGADLRARQQAVRSAQARFERAEAELAAAEGGDPDRETAAMEGLEQAARNLREAEAALDRARQRRQP
jgi:hypothetical protein